MGYRTPARSLLMSAQWVEAVPRPRCSLVALPDGRSGFPLAKAGISRCGSLTPVSAFSIKLLIMCGIGGILNLD
ncbi:MAG: hypothetical protein WD079_02965, partial [Phycisphaeraceae bacterium]